ncbi:MAG: TfoX/Sxy family protein [Anaerolineales bacterium]
MGYDRKLAERIAHALKAEPGISEREMFGGIGYMLQGNMACGVINDEMIVRVGPDAWDQRLQEPGVHVFDMTGRTMRGWVVVEAQALATDADLGLWIERALAFVRTLPPKVKTSS